MSHLLQGLEDIGAVGGIHALDEVTDRLPRVRSVCRVRFASLTVEPPVTPRALAIALFSGLVCLGDNF